MSEFEQVTIELNPKESPLRRAIRLVKALAGHGRIACVVIAVALGLLRYGRDVAPPKIIKDAADQVGLRIGATEDQADNAGSPPAQQMSFFSRITQSANAACYSCDESFRVPEELVNRPVKCGTCYAVAAGDELITHYLAMTAPPSNMPGLPPLPHRPVASLKGAPVLLAPLGKVKRTPPPEPKIIDMRPRRMPYRRVPYEPSPYFMP